MLDLVQILVVKDIYYVTEPLSVITFSPSDRRMKVTTKLVKHIRKCNVV